MRRGSHSGSFGVNAAYLKNIAAVEIKVGQGRSLGRVDIYQAKRSHLDIPDKNDPAGHRCAVTISAS